MPRARASDACTPESSILGGAMLAVESGDLGECGRVVLVTYLLLRRTNLGSIGFLLLHSFAEASFLFLLTP